MIVAEIKSAIELAMERTKNLIMDEEEKKQLLRKDLEDKLKAVMRRFLEGMTDRERFYADYRGIEGDRLLKRSLLTDLAIHGFEESIDNARLFELLEVLGEDAGSLLGDEAKALKTGFESESALTGGRYPQRDSRPPRGDGDLRRPPWSRTWPSGRSRKKRHGR